MKRFFAFASLALMLVSCYDDSEMKARLDDLDDRLSTVEQKVATLNIQLTNLQGLMNGKLFISSVEDKGDGTHVITFVTSAGEMSTLTITDGKDGATPKVSVQQTPDGKWYWTVDGEWLLDSNGDKIPVTGDRGVTPSLKIENGKWYVSYDNGVTYVECGKATGDDGDAFFRSAEVSEDGRLVYLTLVDGTVLTFNMYREFGIAVDVSSALIYSGQTKKFAYTIMGADKNTELEVLPKGNWEAEIEATDESNGFIVVTAPDIAATGKVILLLSDGAGKVIMRTLTFVAGNMEVSTSSVESPFDGGTFNVDVTTNLEFTVSFEEEVSWARLVETKAYEVYTKTIAVTVDRNTLPYARSAKLVLRHQDNVIETILIYQNPIVYSSDRMVFMMMPLAKDSKVEIPVTPYTGEAYYVDWGDGSKIDTLTANKQTHLYEDATRIYPVQVWGRVRALGKPTQFGHESDIHEVIQWGDSSLGLTGISFDSNKSITKIAAPKGDELSQVANCNRMFYNCQSLKEIPVEFMNGLSSKTTNFNYAFTGCSSLENLDPDFFKHFTEGELTIMQMFKDCAKLKSVPSLKYCKVSNQAGLVNGVFSGCTSLETVPADFYPESAKSAIKANQMTGLFYNCKSLKSIPDGFWDNLPLDKIERLNNTFYGCESLTSESLGFLNRMLKVWSWSQTFCGCTSLTTLPEYEVEIDGEKVSIPVYKRGDDAYKAYFANKSCSSTYCFKDCINLEGYYDRIPQAWGGAWDGTTEAPTIEVSATLPEKATYYAVDFLVKGKSVQNAKYYLTAKVIADELLPKYNNSLSELCEAKGVDIEAEYIKAINSTQGLTLNFEAGVPNVEYILVVCGNNMFGSNYAYTTKATTEVPKGSEEYERFLGEWHVKSDFSVIQSPNYDFRPIEFDITIEPYRVDSIYNVYGWGVTTFADTYPMKMFLEDGKLTAWTGAHHGSLLNVQVPYSDGITYNVALNSFVKYAEGEYGVYALGGERVGEAEYAEGGFSMVGVASAEYAEKGETLMCAGFDFCLTMGGPGWSKIFIAPEYTKEQYLVTVGGVQYAPYMMAPYAFTRKTSATTASSSRMLRRNAALGESKECLPVAFPAMTKQYEVKNASVRIGQ